MTIEQFKNGAGEYWEPEPNSGCWIWTRAYTSCGYGKMHLYGRKERGAHRVAYETWIDKIPEGMFVLHKCDTPACVNPQHLFIGTQADNRADCASKGRTNTRSGEDCPLSKLTEDDVGTIRLLLDCGVSGRQVAKIFSVAHQTVSQIKLRRTWKQVSE